MENLLPFLNWLVDADSVALLCLMLVVSVAFNIWLLRSQMIERHSNREDLNRLVNTVLPVLSNVSEKLTDDLHTVSELKVQFAELKGMLYAKGSTGAEI